MQPIRNLVVGAFIGACAVAGPAWAAEGTPRVDKRENAQNARIEKNAEAGNLRPHEERQLERQQNHIDNIETRAKADGDVTKAERANLHRAQKNASQNIRRQSNDDQDRVRR